MAQSIWWNKGQSQGLTHPTHTKLVSLCKHNAHGNIAAIEHLQHQYRMGQWPSIAKFHLGSTSSSLCPFYVLSLSQVLHVILLLIFVSETWSNLRVWLTLLIHVAVYRPFSSTLIDVTISLFPFLYIWAPIHYHEAIFYPELWRFIRVHPLPSADSVAPESWLFPLPCIILCTCACCAFHLDTQYHSIHLSSSPAPSSFSFSRFTPGKLNLHSQWHLLLFWVKFPISLLMQNMAGALYLLWFHRSCLL